MVSSTSKSWQAAKAAAMSNNVTRLFHTLRDMHGDVIPFDRLEYVSTLGGMFY
jgi:hypothetical protein